MIRRENIPNAISIARILLMFPAIWMLLDEQYGIAMIFFSIAGISDALDGFLAKRYGWQSQIGGVLDPLADKILLISVFVSLAWMGAIPWWFVIVISLRDLGVFAGGIYYNVTVEKFTAEPSLVSKLNTTMQILLVLLVVLDLWKQWVPEWILSALIFGVLVAAIWSFVGYVLKWLQKAEDHEKHLS